MTKFTDSKFKIISIGWEPLLINEILETIKEEANISFIHALVGDASRLPYLQDQYPATSFISLSNRKKDESLPEPDLKLLTSLESVGVQTVRSMIRGDPYIRHLPERMALGYATLIASRLKIIFEDYRPDIVLASHDCLHSSMALAVAKSYGIPFVALVFPVIPDNLTGFCKALTPNSLVPIARVVNDDLRHEAKSLILNLRNKTQKVIAYQAPFTAWAYTRKLVRHFSNFLRRLKGEESAGIDEFTAPPLKAGAQNVIRRTLNRLCFPSKDMLWSPPEGAFVYFPFHMAPESMLDTWAPFYQNQLAFVEQVAQAIPIDMSFVVKLHFSDPDNYSRRKLKELMSLPGMHIAHPSASGSIFLEKAALVIGITGTSCLEAALIGKPVIVFGDSPYINFPRSEPAERPDKLYGQIRRMMGQPPPTDNEIVEAYAAYMARFMSGRINDWSSRFTEEELQRLTDCFRALARYVVEPANRLNWYKSAHFSA